MSLLTVLTVAAFVLGGAVALRNFAGAKRFNSHMLQVYDERLRTARQDDPPASGTR